MTTLYTTSPAPLSYSTVTTLYTTSPAPLSYSTASVGLPVPFSAANRLSRSMISVSNDSPNGSLTMRFQNDGPKPPATDPSNRSLCCTNNVRLQYTTLGVIYVSFPIRCGSPSIVETATLQNEVDRENDMQRWPWEKADDGRYSAVRLTVCPWALLSVRVNAVLIVNLLLQGLKGMVGSDEHN